MFADDILIFYRVIPIMPPNWPTSFPLTNIARVSVLTMEKPYLYGKCSSRSSNRIKVIFKFRSSSFPSKYLGAPMLWGCTWKDHFQPLVATIRDKLGGWPASSLSFAGRLMLVRHVLATIPLQLGMVLPIPISVCKAIEKCMQNFLWFTSSEK